MSLTIADILQSDDQQIQAVECPEWGGTCYIRTLSSDERDLWELARSEGSKSVRASLVGISLCDENGRPLNPTEAELAGLGKKAAGPMDRLFDAVLSLNAMRANDVEKLEKNLPQTAGSA